MHFFVAKKDLCEKKYKKRVTFVEFVPMCCNTICYMVTKGKKMVTKYGNKNFELFYFWKVIF